MAYRVKKPCRVCGKIYTPCSDCENDNYAFHWRTVACSDECGKKYLERVMEERNKSISKTNPVIEDDGSNTAGEIIKSVSNTKLLDSNIDSKPTRKRKSTVKQSTKNICD